MPTFQEQLDAFATQFVPPEKAAEAKAILSPLMDAMTRTFQGYDTDLNALKGKLRSLEGIKPEDYTRLDNEAKEAKAALLEATNTIGATKTEIAKAKEDYQTAITQLKALKGQVTASKVETEVRKALGSFKIAPDSIEDVYGILASKVQQKEDGSLFIPHTVKRKNELDIETEVTIESPVSTYVEKVWAVSPFAKRVTLADRSSGGGARGSDQNNGAAEEAPKLGATPLETLANLRKAQ